MSGRRDEPAGDAVQMASEQSFPASDPPALTPDEPGATSDRSEAAHQEYVAVGTVPRLLRHKYRRQIGAGIAVASSLWPGVIL
jgi:hypothetical protein